MLITKVKNEKGEVITSRKGIANVFGEFYKKLYDDNVQEETEQENGENENESSIDVHNRNTNTNDDDENSRDYDRRVANCNQQTQKKAKSADSNRIRVEDIKACDDETREMVRQIFNEIIKQNEFTPAAWKKVRIKSDTQRKGDVEDVGDYHPICSLPALYKLFTTILYSRLYPRLDQEQAEDQAGFRCSHQTTDHLARRTE